MNIGEKFYCSRCLTELDDEKPCNICGYDPRNCVDIFPNALEEGTTLQNMRFHIGAVRRKLKGGYVYGAYDYDRQKPTYIFEYFPAIGLMRDEFSSKVIVMPENEAEFEHGRKKLLSLVSFRRRIFSENNTLYIFRP